MQDVCPLKTIEKGYKPMLSRISRGLRFYLRAMQSLVLPGCGCDIFNCTDDAMSGRHQNRQYLEMVGLHVSKVLIPQGLLCNVHPDETPFHAC